MKQVESDVSLWQVLIDHNTMSGFESIAEAREQLLKLGRKELGDPEWDGSSTRGSHVVAPVIFTPPSRIWFHTHRLL